MALDGALNEVSNLSRHLNGAHGAAQQLSEGNEKVVIIGSLREALENSERLFNFLIEAKAKELSRF